MPELKLNPTEALLLAHVGGEEGRLRQEKARLLAAVDGLDAQAAANFTAAVRSIFETRGEPLPANPPQVVHGDTGRPDKLTWQKPEAPSK